MLTEIFLKYVYYAFEHVLNKVYFIVHHGSTLTLIEDPKYILQYNDHQYSLLQSNDDLKYSLHTVYYSTVNISSTVYNTIISYGQTCFTN